MTDLEKAKAMLESGDYGNCVLYSNGMIHTSKARGISPMLEFISSGLDIKGFSAADTIVGKAAALLFAYAKIKEVYANVMSKSAVDVFKRFEIRYVYGELTENIQNRDKTDLCPMEIAVQTIEEPADAVEVIKIVLAHLKRRGGPM